MALNANKTYAPTPVQSSTTGAVQSAPEGTACPSDARATLSSPWSEDSGYVDENGIVLAVTRSTTPLRDWSKKNVRNLLSEFTGAITVSFLQVDEFSAKAIFGEECVTVTAATTSHGEQLAIGIGAELPEIKAYCFSMKDGDRRVRVFVPRGQFTEIGEMTFKPDTGHVIGGTMSTYDDADGKSVYVLYDDGEVVSG